MSAPNNPTLREIVLEGLAKAGDRNPKQEIIDRAEDDWIEEIKNAIRFESPKLNTLS